MSVQAGRDRRRDEMRPITALFADIVGSTRLGERLGPDEAKALVGECVSRWPAPSRRSAERSQAYMGDGICAYFGVPTAHEDDPERAARAALRIMRVAEEYAVDDPATGEQRAAIRLPDGSLPSSLAVGSGSSEGIWVVNELAGTVSRIDPTTDEVADTFTVDAPTAVTADDEGVWVSSNANDSVVRFDPKTGTTIQTLSLEAGDGIPNGPTTIRATSSGVWLASNVEHVLVRIDPADNTVGEPLRVAGIADGLASDAAGNVWVTVHAP